MAGGGSCSLYIICHLSVLSSQDTPSDTITKKKTLRSVVICIYKILRMQGRSHQLRLSSDFDRMVAGIHVHDPYGTNIMIYPLITLINAAIDFGGDTMGLLYF